jgi:hypothetical protein
MKLHEKKISEEEKWKFPFPALFLLPFLTIRLYCSRSLSLSFSLSIDAIMMMTIFFLSLQCVHCEKKNMKKYKFMKKEKFILNLSKRKLFLNAINDLHFIICSFTNIYHLLAQKLTKRIAQTKFINLKSKFISQLSKKNWIIAITFQSNKKNYKIAKHSVSCFQALYSSRQPFILRKLEAKVLSSSPYQMLFGGPLLQWWAPFNIFCLFLIHNKI